MPHSRTPSFGDDDLQIISSQALSTPGDDRTKSPLLPINPNAEIIDLSGSPGPITKGAANATSAPMFGHPTQIQKRFQPKKPNIFVQQKTRPEHHRDYKISAPSMPKYEEKPAAPMQMFSSTGLDAQPTHQYSQSTLPYTDTVFYTDPAKASEDLKALLEGGMDEDEEKEKDESIEDGTQEGIKVKLLPHQVEGVEWMRGRELGPVKRGKVPKGGILADDMGLGKTLQSISLIISNPMPSKEDKGWKKHFEHVKPTTLVVAPLALLRQWEQEIKEKVSRSHQLKVCVHHGQGRTKDWRELARHDVVITTYQILVSEHGHSSPQPEGVQAGCFGVHWYRVILDEAHSIKNRNAKATKACCALRAEYRWCLTGTPMQNNLDELQSLVHFLRIAPYAELSEWRQQIDAPMKNGKGHIAIRRLHSLLRCFMKRRTKDILKEEGALNPGGKKAIAAAVETAAHAGEEPKAPTPSFKITERKVVTVAAEFSPAERKFYDQLEARADKSIEAMMRGKAVNYANALVLLLRLRQVCNHPELATGKIDMDRDALAVDTAPPKGSDADVDALADALGGMAIQTKKCEMCMTDLSREEVADGMARCKACIESLDKLNNDTIARKRSDKKKKVKRVVKEEVKIEIKQKKPRSRRIITDSDDEEDDGSWLVPEDKRGSLRLGKAGGEEDENAEGEGESIGSEDSIHHSEDEDGSQLDSFVVKDEGVQETACSDDDDTFLSVSKIGSQVVPARSSQQSSTSEDESDADSADESGISESEADPFESSDEYPPLVRIWGPRKTGKKRGKIMPSAKIRQLVSILRKEVAEHKFIVFSQFTSMLDLIEPFFEKEAGFKFARYDGSMRNDEREASLRALRTDPHTRILLCSLKCGSLGLNLTAATRVVIVEPFWNPFVEEQAIDRVHRLTQTVDVVVYKLTVAHTVEERILELQEKKRLLAQAAIEGGMKKKDKNALKLGLKEILELFRHDARDGPDNGPGGEGQFSDGNLVEEDVGIMRSLANMRSDKSKRRDGASQEDHPYSRRW